MIFSTLKSLQRSPPQSLGLPSQYPQLLCYHPVHKRHSHSLSSSVKKITWPAAAMSRCQYTQSCCHLQQEHQHASNIRVHCYLEPHSHLLCFPLSTPIGYCDWRVEDNKERGGSSLLAPPSGHCLKCEYTAVGYLYGCGSGGFVYFVASIRCSIVTLNVLLPHG